jgi:hypothetical protein
MQDFLSQVNGDILVLYCLGFSLLILVITTFLQERKLKKLLKGKSANDLLDSFKNIEKEYRSMKAFKEAMTDYLGDVEKRLSKSVQTVETLRFNPWKGNGEGGNQSFASAFLNEEGDGLIISSLHSRDRISIFAKPIKQGKSQYDLSDEEKEVLNKAIGNVQSKKV